MLLFGPLAASVLTAAIIACLRPDGFLAAAPLRYLGKISYGLYLYSMPIFILAKTWAPHVPAVLLIPFVVPVAGLSYEFIEKPCLRLKDRLGARTALPQAVAAE